MQFRALIQDKTRRRDQYERRNEEIRGDRRGLIVFREPFADQRSARKAGRDV